MDLASLKLFIDVTRAGSFAAAARLHGIDPSSVSRVIGVLEQQLGFRLFQRTTRRLTTTEAGALYFERVQPLLEEMERAQSEASDIITEPLGWLRVTSSVAFGHMCLVPLLPKLRERFPALQLDLVLTDTIVDLIAEHIDVAIRLGPRIESGLIGSKLAGTRYRVCASPAFIKKAGSIRRPQDLTRFDCLRLPLPGYRSRWRFRNKRGTVLDVPIQGSIVISSVLAIQRAAVDGMGPALLADWLIREDLTKGRLIDLFPGYDVTATDFDTAAWLLYPSRAYLPRKVRAFIDFLKSEFGGGGDRRLRPR